MTLLFTVIVTFFAAAKNVTITVKSRVISVYLLQNFI